MDLIFMLRDKSMENKIDMFFKVNLINQNANTQRLLTLQEVTQMC